MKYVLSWAERLRGSAIEYENAQKRILGVFRQWTMPDSITVHQFLVRVGEYGGYMLVETDDLLAVHKLTSTFPAFSFRVEPVVEISDAVGAKLEDRLARLTRHRLTGALAGTALAIDQRGTLR